MKTKLSLSSVIKSEKARNYRHVSIVHGIQAKTSIYKSNRVYSKQYTFLNLMPKAMLNEFKNLSYIWFFIVVFLDFFCKDDTKGWKLYPLVPFVTLLAIVTISNFFRALRRYKANQTHNNLETRVWDKTVFRDCKSENLIVGNIVLVKDKEIVPADMILLSFKSKDPNTVNQDIIYNDQQYFENYEDKPFCNSTQTKIPGRKQSLINQTNDQLVYLNMKKILGDHDLAIKKPIKNTELIKELDIGIINCPLRRIESIKIITPNNNFTSFKGKIKFKGNPKACIVENDNFVVGGSKVIGSEWILGLVVYTGMETKVWINSTTESLVKHSKIEKTINKVQIINVVIIGILVAISTILNQVYSNFLDKDEISAVVTHFILLYANMIPVSMFLCLEISKILSMFILNWEHKKFRIKDPKVLQDLGKVEFVLTGKIGIINKHKLELSALVFYDKIYLKEPTQIISDCELNSINNYNLIASENEIQIKSPNFLSFSLLKDQILEGEVSEDYLNLYFCACLCSYSSWNVNNKYCSPSSKSMLKSLAEIGICVKEKKGNIIIMKIANKEYEFDLYAEYTKNVGVSATSVLVKFGYKEDFILFVKGSVDAIKPLVYDEIDAKFINGISNCGTFLTKRKVVYAYKQLSSEDGEFFLQELHNARLSPMNVENRIESAFEKYGKDLTYLGIAGLEHEITEETQTTVSNLNNAGIKTWLVTGAKEENSLVACFGSKIFPSSCKIINLNGFKNGVECLKALRDVVIDELVNSQIPDLKYKLSSDTTKAASSGPLIKQDRKIRILNDQSTPEFYSPVTRDFKRQSRIKRKHTINPLIADLANIPEFKTHTVIDPRNIDFYMLIDANILEFALSSLEHRKLFAMLLVSAKAVCFHSMMPNQKINVVRLLQNNIAYNPRVLALSDGISNNGMLDEASISVCVRKGGKNVCLPNNVEISKLSELEKLVLVDGQNSYFQQNKIFLYFIYSQTMMATLMFLYQTSSNFSGTSVIDYDFLILYETLFCFVPSLTIGIFDKKVNASSNFSFTHLTGFVDLLSKKKKIAFYYFIGFCHGSIIYVLINYGMGKIVQSKGFTNDLESQCTVMFLVTSLTFTQVVFINTKNLCFATWVMNALNISLIILITSLIYPNQLTSYTLTPSILLNRSDFWICVLTIPIFCSLVYILANLILYTISKIRIRQRLETFKNYFEQVFKDSKDWHIEKIKDSLQINYHSLIFASEYRENQYQEAISEKFHNILSWVSAIITIMSLCYTILIFTHILPEIAHMSYSIIPVALFFIITLCSIWGKITPKYIAIIYFAFLLVAISIYSALNSLNSFIMFPCLQVVYSVLIYFKWRLTLLKIFIIFIFSCALGSCETFKSNSGHAAYDIAYLIILNLQISIICGILSYYVDLLNRNQYAFYKNTEIKLENVSNILGYLLPAFVKKRVKDGVRYIAEDKGTVSVLFCDICDFDKIVSEYTSQELTFFLDDLFGKLDKICEIVGVTKIETVGKTYLACAGLKDSEREMNSYLVHVPHARRAIEMGLSILRETMKIKLKNGDMLKVKIGINSGPVTAGVVGYHKPQFSLVGDTVNTASRMSSTLTEYNSIQISLECYELLGDIDGLSFTKIEREVKGKGIMQTFIVNVCKELAEEYYSSSHPSSGFSGIYAYGKASVIEISNESEFNMKAKKVTRGFTKALNGKERRMSNKGKIYHFWNIFSAEFHSSNEFYAKSLQPMVKVGIVITLVSNFFLIILSCVKVINIQDIDSRFKLGYFVFEEIVMIIWVIFLKKVQKNTWHGYVLAVIYSLQITAFFIETAIIDTENTIELLFLYSRFLLTTYCTDVIFSRSLLVNIFFTALWLIKISIFAYTAQRVWFSIFFLFCTFCASLRLEYSLRIYQKSKEAALKELEKTEQLLTQMMPFHVFQRLQQETSVTDNLNQVTVMYADIVGFTAWSSEKSSIEVVEMLSELFTRFDKTCLDHDVYKVHTIGDCYVAMGYKGDVQRNPGKEALNMVNFALSLIDLIEEVNKKCNCKLKMRIGLHTGEVIGGITGTNIVRYDIYGQDVMLANKMESNGVPGRVAVSEMTKALLEDYECGKFNFEMLKEVKNNKEMINLFLLSQVR